MSDPAATPPAIGRIATHVPGLDEITGGGLLRSGVYILQGSPGAGKTILANQIVHRHAAAGGHIVYVTLLAESHGRLLQHMEVFSFFQPSLLPDQVYYVSAFNALRTAGLAGVVELLRTEMRSHRASIVVLDGLVMAETCARSDEDLKMFISDIQAHSTLVGCTTLLLTSEDPDRPVSAEHTMVDGVFLLRERAYGPRRERNIEIVKFRGSSTLRGNHAFRIGPDGITIYPRLEAARRDPVGDTSVPVGVSSGIPSLDAMFDISGYAKGSVTAVTGRSGSGKTTLGLHFAARASAQEKTIFFGFYEAPELLVRMGDVLGLALAPQVAAGDLRFIVKPFGENMLDALAAELLGEVARSGAGRVVIDGVGGFTATQAYPERGSPFLSTLMNELRRLGVTTFLTIEENDANHRRDIDTSALSAIADALLQLQVQDDGVVRRFIAVRKTRLCRSDLRQRELVLTDTGVAVVDRGAAAPS